MLKIIIFYIEKYESQDKEKKIFRSIEQLLKYCELRTKAITFPNKYGEKKKHHRTEKKQI